MPKFLESGTGYKLLNAVVIVPDPVIAGRNTGKRFHKIRDTPFYTERFENEMKKKFPTATCVNYYRTVCGEKGPFCKQVKF